jgi:glutathione peroxidase
VTLGEFDAKTLGGEAKSLADYAGQVVLVVNVASACGYTPQYAGLEALYRKFKDQGFAVLGFPCNQFGAQEPGNEADIAAFCKTTYDVTFPMFAKVDVNGADAHPLFKWLKADKKGILGTEAIKWNFTKFLIGRDGQPIKRYGSADTPESIAKDVETALRA